MITFVPIILWLATFGLVLRGLRVAAVQTREHVRCERQVAMLRDMATPQLEPEVVQAMSGEGA